MASGDQVLIFNVITPPSASPATPDVRAGGSSPPETFPVWDFDATNNEYLDITGMMSENYSGCGIDLTVGVLASTATSGSCDVGAAFRNLLTDDYDTSHSYSYNYVTIAAPSVSGERATGLITFTDGADMDSVAAGNPFVLRIRRNPSASSDNMSGDMEFTDIVGYET